ncbi:MAG: SDR family oxidoreductase [Saprospiraceae bacterium]|nr:SDR family oxidoreductase [Saprospiraceae bacterium]
MKNIVITGASTGIGYTTSKALIKKGYRVFGSVRKKSDADKLSKEFGKNFHPLIFDVTDADAVISAAKKTGEIIGEQGLSALINNAGIAVGGPLMHMPLEDFRWQIEVNVLGLLSSSQAFLPLLGAKKNCGHRPGRILNISSVAGKVSNPFMGAYCASKHAVEAISDTMRIELQLYGIDVITIGPGVVKTPIWNKAEDFDLSKYENTDYKQSGYIIQKFMQKLSKNGFEQEIFGKMMVKIIETKKPKTRYPLVYQKFRNWTLLRMIPRRTLDKIIGKKLGLIK